MVGTYILNGAQNLLGMVLMDVGKYLPVPLEAEGVRFCVEMVLCTLLPCFCLSFRGWGICGADKCQIHYWYVKY